MADSVVSSVWSVVAVVSRSPEAPGELPGLPAAASIAGALVPVVKTEGTDE